MDDEIFLSVLKSYRNQQKHTVEIDCVSEDTKSTDSVSVYVPEKGDIVVGRDDDYLQPRFFKVIGKTKKCFKVQSYKHRIIQPTTSGSRTLIEPDELHESKFIARLPKNKQLWRVRLGKGNYRNLYKYRDGDKVYYTERF